MRRKISTLVRSVPIQETALCVEYAKREEGRAPARRGSCLRECAPHPEQRGTQNSAAQFRTKGRPNSVSGAKGKIDEIQQKGKQQPRLAASGSQIRYSRSLSKNQMTMLLQVQVTLPQQNDSIAKLNKMGTMNQMTRCMPDTTHHTVRTDNRDSVVEKASKCVDQAYDGLLVHRNLVRHVWTVDCSQSKIT